MTPIQEYLARLSDDQLDSCFRDCLKERESMEGETVPLKHFEIINAMHAACVDEYARRSESRPAMEASR